MRPLTPADVPRLAVALVVLLLFDAAAVTILPRPVTLKAPDELAEVVPELQGFVEKTRGRRFHRQVKIRRSDNLGDFTTGLGQTDTQSREQQARDAAVDQAAVLRALGMVDQPYDPLAADRTISNEVLGVYNPAKHELVVRTGPVTPRMRVTLVHELTHALDGEHHELRISRRADRLVPDESANSFRALAEGSAMFVESRYLDSLPAEDKAAIEGARKPSPANVPDTVLFLAAYPYTAGRAFVESLVQQGGTKAIDRALEHPPTTSEQVLNVDRYLADEQPLNIEKPRPADRLVVQRGVFGEVLLRLLVAKVGGNDQARQVGTGWGGGRYVAWRSGVSVCVSVTLVMDTPQDTAELVAALRQWTANKPQSRLAEGTPVRFENCVQR